MDQLRNLLKFISANRILALILVVVAMTMMGGVTNFFQRRAEANIAVLREKNAALETSLKTALAERDTARLEAERQAKVAGGWEKVANEAMAQVGKINVRLKNVEAELAKIPKVTSTPVEHTPTTVQGVVDEFKKLDLPAIPVIPQHNGADVGFSLEPAREVLALATDGKQLPTAILRADLLEEKTEVLEEKVDALTQAYEAKDKEATAWEGAYETEKKATDAATTAVETLKEQRANDKEIIKNKDTIIRTERTKKWLWGGGGMGLGALLILLL